MPKRARSQTVAAASEQQHQNKKKSKSKTSSTTSNATNTVQETLQTIKQWLLKQPGHLLFKDERKPVRSDRWAIFFESPQIHHNRNNKMDHDSDDDDEPDQKFTKQWLLMQLNEHQWMLHMHVEVDLDEDFGYEWNRVHDWNTFLNPQQLEEWKEKMVAQDRKEFVEELDMDEGRCNWILDRVKMAPAEWFWQESAFNHCLFWFWLGEEEEAKNKYEWFNMRCQKPAFPSLAASRVTGDLMKQLRQLASEGKFCQVRDTADQLTELLFNLPQNRRTSMDPESVRQFTSDAMLQRIQYNGTK